MRFVALSIFKLFWAIFFSGLILVGVAGAQTDQDSTEKRLKKIQADIRREETRLKELRSKESKLLASLNELKEERRQMETRLTKLNQTLKKIASANEHLTSRIQDLDKGLQVKRKTLQQRVVAIYKTRRKIGVVDYLVGARNTSELLQRSRYLNLIASHDQARMAQLSEAISELDQRQQQLQILGDKRRRRLDDLKELSVKLEAKRFQQAKLLDEVNLQKEKRTRTLEDLKRSAAKLEGMLSRLMGADEDAKKITRDVPRPKLLPPFKGNGLRRVKGKLDLPVAGSELVRGFGKRKHEEFSDIVLSKGLEFKAPVGAKVKAVAPGKVIFSQVLPGFGNVIIVDHGKRYYSLYGRLATSLVRKGDQLRESDVLAVLGQLGPKATNFYFEIRQKGKAVNPVPFFRKSVRP